MGELGFAPINIAHIPYDIDWYSEACGGSDLFVDDKAIISADRDGIAISLDNEAFRCEAIYINKYGDFFTDAEGCQGLVPDILRCAKGYIDDEMARNVLEWNARLVDSALENKIPQYQSSLNFGSVELFYPSGMFVEKITLCVDNTKGLSKKPASRYFPKKCSYYIGPTGLIAPYPSATYHFPSLSWDLFVLVFKAAEYTASLSPLNDDARSLLDFLARAQDSSLFPPADPLLKNQLKKIF